MFADIQKSLLLCLQSNLTIERSQAAIQQKLISHCADGGNISQILVGRVPGCCKMITGRGSGNIQITLQTKQLRVQVMHHGIGSWVGFVVIQNQGEIFPAVQIRYQRCDPPGKIGKDNQFPLLGKHSFQDRRIRFFQAEAFNVKTLAFKCTGQNGAGSQPVRIVVVEQLYGFFRPFVDLMDRLFHGGDKLLKHVSSPIDGLLSAGTESDTFKLITRNFR